MSATRLIVISDTNIFIDLISVELYECFLSLGYKIYTNIFVVNELEDPEQRAIVEGTDGLYIEQFEEVGFVEEVLQFFEMRTRRGLSFTDCAVLYQGIRHKAAVLTGDKKMIKMAKEKDIDVHGILFIFDEMVRRDILPPPKAIIKLRQLFEHNPRLPADEIEFRIERWSELSGDCLS